VPGRQFQTDAELLEAARNYSQTIYHPTSTCKMGVDADAVVDPVITARQSTIRPVPVKWGSMRTRWSIQSCVYMD
jgi:hypothetical protein